MDQPKKKILVIEDDSMMRRIFEHLINPAQYECESLPGGADILDTLRAMEQKPAIVLIDLMMPNVSGFDILTFMKSDPSWKEVPAVIVTNAAEKEHQEKAREMGAALYLVKSEHDPKELIALIEEVIRTGGH